MPVVASTQETSGAEKTAHRELGLSLLTLVGAAAGVVLYHPLLLITTPVVVYLWRDVFKGADQALFKDHRVSVDVLYSLTTILAIAHGYLFLIAIVCALFCFSNVLAGTDPERPPHDPD
jgi:cation transport ATPase